MVELVFISKRGQKIILDLFSIIHALDLELLSFLYNTSQNPSARCIGKCAHCIPHILGKLIQSLLRLKVIPFDVLYLRYKFLSRHIHLSY